MFAGKETDPNLHSLKYIFITYTIHLDLTLAKAFTLKLRISELNIHCKAKNCSALTNIVMKTAHVCRNTIIGFMLLYQFSSFALTEENPGTRCLNPALFKKFSLVKLTGATLSKTYERQTILDCQVYCSQSQVCKSINIKKRDDGYFDCELLEHNKDSSVSPLTMSSTHNWIHFEVSILILRSSILDGPVQCGYISFDKYLSGCS